MPNPPTSNMGLVLPTDQVDTGVWGSLLATVFAQIDQHDHSTGKGVKVPMPAGTSVTGDTSWASGGSFFAITNVKAVDFQPLLAANMLAYSGALFVDSSNNELTWRTVAGTNVRLTNGTSINASLIGGIGGDYASAGALLDFTDGTDTYALRQQVGSAVRQYARLQTADVDFFEYKAQPAAGVPANRVRVKSPTSLAASYDLTWLTALPASVAVMTVDNTGQMAAAVSLALASNANITLSGTGDLKHGDREIVISASQFVPAGTTSTTAALGDFWTFGAPPADIVQGGIPLRVGDRIKTITWFFSKNGSSNVLTMTFRRRQGSTTTTLDTLADVTSGAGFVSVPKTGLNYTIVTGDAMYLVVQAGSSAHRFDHASIIYDRP